MKIMLNGETRSVTAANVAELVDQLGLGAGTAVEVNQQLVPKSQHAETPLGDGDSVEVVTLVGGG